MEKLISESALYEAIYKLPIRRERADGENYNYFVPIASIFEMLEKLPPANTSETPNSSDTISRQAAIEALDEIEAEVADGYGYQYAKWREYFVEMQSAQPDIIRCRNCKFASGDSRICMKFDHSPIGELDFCAWAERRTDE